MVKLNVGSGPRKYPEFTNMDALPWNGNTDVLHDITETPYPFEDESFQEILMVEVLEHISFNSTQKVLKELYRILKPTGHAKIQVPDCGKMMEYYVNKQICDCVGEKGFEANPSCSQCAGQGKVQYNRWLYSFIGQQKHRYDAHLNIFTRQNLQNHLESAKFSNLEFIDHPHKLIVIARK